MNLFEAILAEDVPAADDDRLEEDTLADRAVHLSDQGQEPFALGHVEGQELLRLGRQTLKIQDLVIHQLLRNLCLKQKKLTNCQKIEQKIVFSFRFLFANFSFSHLVKHLNITHLIN